MVATPSLTVRPMVPDDVGHFVDYLHELTPEDSERMGIPRALVPPRETLRKSMLAFVATPEQQAVEFYLVWCLDGRPIGTSSLKNIKHGDSGEMHLHMWAAPERGKGHGAVFFCLCAVDFFERFKLKAVICEPRAANPLPNRMLQRVGFPFLGSRRGASSALSAVTDLNRYAVELSVAQQYLQQFRKG